MPTETKDQSRIAELTKALESKSQEIDGMSNSWRTEDNGEFVISSDQHKAFVKAVNEAEEIKGLIEAEEKAGSIRDYLREPQGTPHAGDDAAAAARGHEAKTLGQRFIESDAYQDMKGSGFRHLGRTMTVDGVSLPTFAALSRKDVHGLSAGTVADIPGLGRAQQTDLIERQVRPDRVRDLFPTDRTTAAVLYGIVETGFTNAARVVPQRETDTSVTPNVERYGLKPRSQITLTTRTYPVATIAHLLDAHKNVLDDEPRLRGLLDRDMIDGVKMAEDEEILYGDGVGENLTGIVNTAGVQAYTQQAGDRKSAAIRRAATRALLSYYTPNGVCMHPFDWEDAELEQDANGQYVIATSVAVGGEKRMWRMRVVDTPAINEGQFLLGAFGQGARLYDRESVSVTVSTESRDNFERNVVTLRAEERCALEVQRPEAFVVGTFV